MWSFNYRIDVDYLIMRNCFVDGFNGDCLNMRIILVSMVLTVANRNITNRFA